MTSSPLNVKFLQESLERVIAKSVKKVMFREQGQMICEKNDIFQKVIKLFINIAGMLNILHKIFK